MMIKISHKGTITILILLILLLPLPGSARGPLAPFEKEGKWGYADPEGKVIIKPQYSMAGSFSKEGIAAVMDEKGWVYINRKGIVLVRPFVVDNGPDYFSEGLARYTERGRFGFFNERGGITIRAQYDFVLPFHEGLAAACTGCRFKREAEHSSVVNGKWGFIDRRGRWVIKPAYESAGNFKYGKATVTKKGHSQNVDRRGSVVSNVGQENQKEH
jgi:hypothetical protein